MTSPSKTRLRQIARRTLARLSPEDRKHRSALLVNHLAESLKTHFPTARRIATFAALPHEPDLSLLPYLLPDRQFCYPLVLSPTEITFHLVTDSTTLQPGAYQIPEPNPQVHPPILPGDLDLLLVPGLAFSLHGHRLGQGAGHYDRYLTQIPTTPTIGITFGSQLLPALPTEPHDRAMSLLASERGTTPILA